MNIKAIQLEAEAKRAATAHMTTEYLRTLQQDIETSISDLGFSVCTDNPVSRVWLMRVLYGDDALILLGSARVNITWAGQWVCNIAGTQAVYGDWHSALLRAVRHFISPPVNEPLERLTPFDAAILLPTLTVRLQPAST